MIDLTQKISDCTNNFHILKIEGLLNSIFQYAQTPDKLTNRQTDKPSNRPMSFRIPKSDDDLLAQCDVETYCSRGPGGQNVNRRETAVRLCHRPTGIVVVCQRERTQYRNKKIGLERLRRKLIQKLKKQSPRIPTSIPGHVREKILEQKKLRSLKKMGRKKTVFE